MKCDDKKEVKIKRDGKEYIQVLCLKKRGKERIWVLLEERELDVKKEKHGARSIA